MSVRQRRLPPHSTRLWDPTSVNNSTFELFDASNNLIGSSVGHNNQHDVPSNERPSLNSASYTALAGGIKDSSETLMASSYSSSFVTTSLNPPPIVTGFSPASGASGVTTTAGIDGHIQ